MTSASRRRGLPGILPALLALALLGAGCLPAAAQDSGGEEPTVVWLVRHAERADDGPAGGDMVAPARQEDPTLSAAGRRRAQVLRTLLADVRLQRIVSTDYRRTRATADPVAAAHGIVVESYDPRDLPGLAARIRAAGGRWLVVGHSNTTPELVEALGGDPGPPIDEFEYDRLYQVVIAPGTTVETTLLRFGG